MSKLILISVVFATIAIPAFAARDAVPKNGLKKAISYTLFFHAFYAFALIYLWGRC
ncbi:MAG TPA: hypothetical protein VER96_32730 [Polyangiaceae bacterium]|nr:hypothetical protein [Polyangiaceae bacterium]